MKRVGIGRNQAGVASIVLTMLMIIIISLIVFSFAQLTRREQRTALDNQLSTQAYYAAESGINEARQQIASQLATGVEADNDCANEQASDKIAATYIGGDPNIRYTCLTINPTPRALSGTATNTVDTVFRLKSNTTFSGRTITITWSKTGEQPLSGCPNKATEEFKAAASWTTCPYGVLRYELVKTDLGVPLTADNLIANSMSGFAVPRSSGGPDSARSFVGNSRGNLSLATSCDNTHCKLQINGLDGTEYYLNTRMLYAAAATVTVVRDDSAEFVDSQAVIDATGKAQDVLRRVQVRQSLFSDDSYSGGGNALNVGDGPCKQQFINAATGEYDAGGCSE